MVLTKMQKRGKTIDSVAALRTVKDLVLVLENGERAAFNVAAELAIDRSDLVRQLADSPAQLAFWCHQSERVRRELDAEERRLGRHEAEHSRLVRSVLRQDSHYSVTEQEVKSVVNGSPEVEEFHVKILSLRFSYGKICAVRDAVKQKCFVLSALLRRENFEKDSL